MTKEDAVEEKESIISDVESLVKSEHYTLEEIVNDIEDRLCHLWE